MMDVQSHSRVHTPELLFDRALLMPAIRSAVWVSITFVYLSSVGHCEEPKAAAVFEQRIMPIFNSPNPSSCIQCHLSAVDLKDYILPSSRETFISLRDQGLVDLEHPEESKILDLIAMGEQDPDSMARRIHKKNREMEYEAFATWIAACCIDPELRAAKAKDSDKAAGPTKPPAVIRHSRKDRILDSFVRNVWSQRMRCFPCHTPAELNPENPMHEKPIQRHADFVAKYGQRMNIFKESPRKTLQALLASSSKAHKNALPLINFVEPAKSLLLLKPMARVPAKDSNGEMLAPSSLVPVSHVGGIKIHKDDHSYKAMVSWIQDYLDAMNGDYQSSDDLPLDNWYPTQHVVRLRGVPRDWPAFKTVQIFLHRKDATSGDWQSEPFAFTQSKITPRKIVNGPLFLIAEPSEKEKLDAEGETLTSARVQMRVYLDHQDRITSDATLMLNDQAADATGVMDAKFGIGFKNADIVEGSALSYR